MAIELSSVVRRDPKQVSGDLDGQVVLLSIQNGEYYNMNGVGSRIWALLEEPIAVSNLIDKLLDEFEVERSTCQVEVISFLSRLEADRILHVEH